MKMLKNFYDLVSEQFDRHLLKTILDGVKNSVLTIINYNDSTSSIELDKISDKTDNDKNTVFLSRLINTYSEETLYKISKVFYLTNTDWVLDENKKTVGWYDNLDITCECEVNRIKQQLLCYIDNSTSDNWTWWMWSKILSGLECLKYWVDWVYICNSENWLKMDGKVTRILSK